MNGIQILLQSLGCMVLLLAGAKLAEWGIASFAESRERRRRKYIAEYRKMAKTMKELGYMNNVDGIKTVFYDKDGEIKPARNTYRY